MNWRELEPQQDRIIRLAVLGDPVEHSLSPKMHTAALAACGIAGEYLPLRVLADEFDEAVQHLAFCGFAGVNVTIPHKERAASIAISDDDVVAFVGAANTLKFGDGMLARNTDAAGFFNCIKHLSPGKALIIGAGGAAAAAAFALARQGWQAAISNRTQSRAAALAQRFNTSLTAIPEPSPAGCSLVVNGTPLGLKPGEMPPFHWNELAPGTTLLDMSYRLEQTDFLAQGRDRGFATIDGREMLVEQGALALEWWTGRSIPRQPMKEAVRL